MTGTKPSAKSSTPQQAARVSTRTHSTVPVHSSRQSGSPDSCAVPPSERSTFSEITS